MKKLLAGFLMGALVMYFYQRPASPVPPVEESARHGELEVEKSTPPVQARFRCDGRTHCSQMTSCDEAKYFLENCPGVQMDGEGDGIPCEKQWCKNHPFR